MEPLHVSVAATGFQLQDADFYNFNNTGFMMGMIVASMIITRCERPGRRKVLQSVTGNRLQSFRLYVWMGGRFRCLS